MNPAPKTVALLAYPECSASVVFGMYDLFMSAGRDWDAYAGNPPGPQLMQPRIVAAESHAFAVANDVRIVPEASLSASTVPDLVCVPDLTVMPGEPLAGRFEAETAWLRACHAGGAVIGTACSGALLLAHAGLLDGHDATTHWAFTEDFRRSYPAVKVCPGRALVASGSEQRLVMAGGGTTWLDLAIYLIARMVSVEAAAPVNAMIELSGLPERSFKRRFQQATGLAPLQYVHTLRIEEAKQMLESGDEPVEHIAIEVGYEDAGFFSRLFQRSVGVTPAQYRRRFGALRRALG